MEWDFNKPATTDTVVSALKGIRKNQMFVLMSAVYGGATPELYWATPKATGPWETRVYYGLDSFDHTYAEGDSSEAFDRIIVTDGFVYLAWNFKWTRTGAGTRLQLIDSYWYFNAGTGRGYEYLGHLDVAMNSENMSAINWDVTADPHDAPTLEE